MTALFADTFYWIALADFNDSAHRWALTITTERAASSLVTTDEVLAEYLNFFSAAPPAVRRQIAVSVRFPSALQRAMRRFAVWRTEAFQYLLPTWRVFRTWASSARTVRRLFMSPHSSEKTRLDRLLVERGLAQSREKAQGLILAGLILVNGQKQEKCGVLVDFKADVRVLGEPPRYVSRGGLKLEGALKHFRLSPEARICLDVGASTGGFTDCLLQHGARRVFAVDGGTHQLDWKLRQDPRVVVLEKTNARYLTFDRIGTPAELVTIDVSFISVTLILPAVVPLFAASADLLVLVKPQFEVGKGQVGKGGIVRDPALHQESLAKVSGKLLELGFRQLASMESPILGAEGNREFFIHAAWKTVNSG
jgi:23S rRNA (cytidine1920-2'-O)/16S rRNA (cytidine1409-2'-O)-methyltransferase